MATSNHFLPIVTNRDSHSLSLSMDDFEFDESDIYNSNSNSARVNSVEFRRSIHGRTCKKPSSSGGRAGAPASVPVNIPDWSKILGDEYRRSNVNIDLDEGYDVDQKINGRLPPHEFLARTRVASFSVHEGVGRTLKGRDLSRVRNAIWAKTGFQD
ncbi:hypothetical protein RJT34_29873 [Clitoria ternatea]|uniref:Senescence regulator n=1 Tax=Clitoria ternatea TaxID=43366 RepID=A0AAN9ERD4_CLITE